VELGIDVIMIVIVRVGKASGALADGPYFHPAFSFHLLLARIRARGSGSTTMEHAHSRMNTRRARGGWKAVLQGRELHTRMSLFTHDFYTK
jgi:hypothetical protein